MNKGTKIKLSPFELKLFSDKDWILTKHAVIEKIYILFGSLSEEYKNIVTGFKFDLPSNISELSPKISRGERYRDLPYVMLDYPRFFSKEDVFAIRTFFWWGNNFSIHLQLKGKYLDQYGAAVIEAIKTGSLNEFFIDLSGDEWNYDVSSNFRKTDELRDTDFQKIKINAYLKMTYSVPLEAWEVIENKFAAKFRLLFGIMCGQLPSR